MTPQPQRRAPQPGDEVKLAELEPGTYVELLGGCVRYEPTDGSDIPIFCARARVMSQLTAGVFLEGWIQSERRWGDLTGAVSTAIGRVVSPERAHETWGIPDVGGR